MIRHPFAQPLGRQAASAANPPGRLVLPMTVGTRLCPHIPAQGRENAIMFSRCRDIYRCLVPVFAWFALLAVGPANTTALDTGAVGSGDWSNPATWTNGVPGAGDNAYIGNNYPGYTVTLSQDSSADGVYLGNGYGRSGTLDLGGFTLTAGSLFLGGYGVGGVGAIQRTGGGTLSISGQIIVSGGSLSLAARDTASSIYTLVDGGASVTTSATGNVTGRAYIDMGSTLNLGANLMLSSELDMYGTLNANGYNISAPTVNLDYPPSTNLGTITATDLTVNSSTFNLTATDNVTNLYLDNATSTFQTGASVQTLGVFGNTIAATSATGNATVNVYVYHGSTLNLGADLALSSELYLQGTLNANGYGINAPNVYLGESGGSATLNNRGPIFSANLVVSSANSPALATFNLTGADSVANFTLDNVRTTFPPNVTILNLSLNTVSTGSTAATSSSGNIANSAVVGPGSTLNLGADLNMYSYLDVQGNFNANGHAVSVSNSAIYLGYNGGPAVVNSNRGVFTTPNLFVSSQDSPDLETFNLIPGDNVTNFVLVGVGTTIPSGASVQNLYLHSSGFVRNPTHSTASTSTNANVTASVYLDPGNTLNLGADLIISGNADVRGTINANGHAIRVHSLSGNGGTINDESAPGSSPTMLTVAQGTTTTFGGTIRDGLNGQQLALTMSGLGTLILSGSNTYSGGTTVIGGTLILNNNGAIADGSSLTVGNAALFAPVIPSASAVTPVTEPGTLASTAVPEPSTLPLCLIALGALPLMAWRRNRTIMRGLIDHPRTAWGA